MELDRVGRRSPWNIVLPAVVLLAMLLPVHPARGADWLYYIGGRDGAGGQTSDVNVIQVLSGGTLSGSWTSLAPLPTPAVEFSAVAVGNDIVVALGGGCGTCGGPCVTDVYFTTVNPSNGSISGWTSTLPLPAAVYSPRLAVDGPGFVYALGPNGGQCWASTYVGGSGVVGWNVQPAPATGAEMNLSAGGGYLWVNGGWTLAPGTYAASFGSGSVGGWTSTTQAPDALYAAAASYAGGYAYIFGGYSLSAGTSVSTIVSAPAAGGALGGWTNVGNMPVAVLEQDVLASVSGYFFLMAGCAGICPCTGTTAIADVYSAPILSGGGVGGWTSQSALPAGRWEGAAALIESVGTATPTPSRTATRTPTRTRTSTSGPAAIATPTCPPVFPGDPGDRIRVDRNVFDPGTELLHILWNTSGTGAFQVSVFDSAGEFVRLLESGSCAGGKLFHAVWDGRNYQDRLVTSNVYVLRLTQLGIKDAVVARVAVGH